MKAFNWIRVWLLRVDELVTLRDRGGGLFGKWVFDCGCCFGVFGGVCQ